MPKDRDIDEALKKVRELGYRVRKPGNYHKTTVVVHEVTLRKFKECVEKCDYTMQEALTEALDNWIKEKNCD